MSPRFEQCWPYGQDFVRLYLSLFISLNILKERLQEIEKVGKPEIIWMVLSHTTRWERVLPSVLSLLMLEQHAILIWSQSSHWPSACMCGTPSSQPAHKQFLIADGTLESGNNCRQDSDGY